MTKKRKWNKADIERMWDEKVTADYRRDPKLLLQQAGDVFLSFSIGAQQSNYHILDKIYPVALLYVRRKRKYASLIKDPYFEVSRKKPSRKDVFRQVMCYSLRAKPGIGREKAQRLGGILELLHAQGVTSDAVVKAIKAMGGMGKARKAAKQHRRKKVSLQRSQPLQIESFPEDAEPEGGNDDHESVEERQNNGKGTKPPTRSQGGSSKRNRKYIQIGATTKQTNIACAAERFGMIVRVEGDPNAKDGWKIMTVEKIKVFK